jgi:hypothetical protein
LLGIIGIILSLPLTAAIPVLERVWNEPLPENVVAAEAEEVAAQEAAEKEEKQQMHRGAFRFRGGR